MSPESVFTHFTISMHSACFPVSWDLEVCYTLLSPLFPVVGYVTQFIFQVISIDCLSHLQLMYIQFEMLSYAFTIIFAAATSTPSSASDSLPDVVQKFWQQGVLVLCDAFVRNITLFSSRFFFFFLEFLLFLKRS